MKSVTRAKSGESGVKSVTRNKKKLVPRLFVSTQQLSLSLSTLMPKAGLALKSVKRTAKGVVTKDTNKRGGSVTTRSNAKGSTTIKKNAKGKVTSKTRTKREPGKVYALKK